MFGCQETQRYVDAWVDGELDPSAALHVEAHVARCSGCRGEAEMIRSLKRTMAGLREGHGGAPSALRSRLAAALAAEDEKTQGEAHAAQRRKHAVGFVVAGAALAGMVLANGHQGPSVTGSVPMQSAGILPPLLEDIAQRHARDLPVEVSGAQPEQVANFFRGRLDIPVRPMAFHGVPAHLVGARISNVRDRMAAALYYDVGGRRMTVFVFDRTLLPRQGSGLVGRTHGNAPVYVGSAGGYSVAFSERGGVAYAVASDLPAQETLRIVERADFQ